MLWVADAVNGKPGLQFEKAKVHLAADFDEQTGGEFAGPLTVCAVFTGAVPKGDNRVVAGVIAGATTTSQERDSKSATAIRRRSNWRKGCGSSVRLRNSTPHCIGWGSGS